MLESAEPSGSERSTVLTDAVRRIRAEFLEMPGLRLTAPQAARLWSVPRRREAFRTPIESVTKT